MISNYTELVAERVRLQSEIHNQKLILKTEIKSFKEKFDPIFDFISFFKIFKQNESRASSLLKTGLSVGIDFLVRDNLLSKAGWVSRTIFPAILKVVSNQFLKKKLPIQKIS